MGQVIEFPKRYPDKFFGLFTNIEIIAAQHMVHLRKATWVYSGNLPDHIRRNRLGEVAVQGVKIDGQAVNQFENLKVYLMEHSA